MHHFVTVATGGGGGAGIGRERERGNKGVCGHCLMALAVLGREHVWPAGGFADMTLPSYAPKKLGQATAAAASLVSGRLLLKNARLSVC